jgi:hypothetical protein
MGQLSSWWKRENRHTTSFRSTQVPSHNLSALFVRIVRVTLLEWHTNIPNSYHTQLLSEQLKYVCHGWLYPFSCNSIYLLIYIHIYLSIYLPIYLSIYGSTALCHIVLYGGLYPFVPRKVSPPCGDGGACATL